MRKVMNSDMLLFLNKEAKRHQYEHHLSPLIEEYIDPDGIHVVMTGLTHDDDIKHCYIKIKAKGMRKSIDAKIDIDRENWENLPLYDDLKSMEQEFGAYNRR